MTLKLLSHIFILKILRNLALVRIRKSIPIIVYGIYKKCRHRPGFEATS